MIWEIVLAAGGACLTAAILFLLLWRPLFNIGVDSFVKRLMKDPYPENIFEMYNVFRKIGVQNVLESDFRANQGAVLQRPFGTSKHFSAWEQLLLNPVYLTRFPLVESVAVDTQVTIGPMAKRPLDVDIPILIAAMGYGHGPSLNAKIAMAKAADRAGTATNSGIGPFLPEERKHVKRLIIQYHRGWWGKEEEVLRQADAIEIQLGFGALGSAPVTLQSQDISPEFRDYMKLQPDQNLQMGARFTDVSDARTLENLVRYLKEVTGGVPVGVKIGATHHLETELEILTAAPLDFLTIDGAEAGINFGPGILEDDVGLPTLPALCRTVQFLQARKLKEKISLLISGGLVTPGQFLKAIALGADAVYIGTVVMIVLAHGQLTKVIPWEPPTELVYERGQAKNKLAIDEASKHLANFLKSCKEEMILGMRSLGRASLRELSPADLCALAPQMAEITGVELGLFPPGAEKKPS